MRQTVTYDANGKILTELRETWDSSTNVWKNHDIYSYFYDPLGNLEKNLYQTWDTMIGNWKNIYQFFFTMRRIICKLKCIKHGVFLLHHE